MANSIVQTIREAEIDARSLSEFISKDAYFTVTRRLAPTIHTLDYYLLVLDKVKDKGDLADIAISDTLDKLDQLEPTVMQRVEDAINNTAIEGGVLADTFVTVTANGAGQVARNQREKNADVVSVKDYGAIGDGTMHTLSEWTQVGHINYYPDLAAIQAGYPHVESLDDSIDWVAIQAALNTGKDVVGAKGQYFINRSLYMGTPGQQLSGLGVIKMSAALGIPALYLGAKDADGTETDVSTWRMKVDVRIYGEGDKTEGSAGISMVRASQTDINLDARGFHAGIRVDGVCLANTFYQNTLLQNTYGLYDPINIAGTRDLQASQFIGGRIELNEREGVLTATPNIKFIGTVIEGNGLFGAGDGTLPEVTLAKGLSGGSVTFSDCYMESLEGKSCESIIAVEAGATKRVFINGGEYYGSLDKNKYVVDILSPASNVVSVMMQGMSLSDCKNYVRGTISGNSRVSVINCFPNADVDITLAVKAGTGNPLIQQIDRGYFTTTSNIRPDKLTAIAEVKAPDIIATVGVTTPKLTTTNALDAPYVSSKSPVFGAVMYDNFLQKRQNISTTVSATTKVIDSSALSSGVNFAFNLTVVGKASATNTHAFNAFLVVNTAGGVTTIEHQSVTNNSKTGQVLLFSVDGSNNIVVTATSGDALNGYMYRTFYDRYTQVLS